MEIRSDHKTRRIERIRKPETETVAGSSKDEVHSSVVSFLPRERGEAGDMKLP